MTSKTFGATQNPQNTKICRKLRIGAVVVRNTGNIENKHLKTSFSEQIASLLVLRLI